MRFAVNKYIWYNSCVRNYKFPTGLCTWVPYMRVRVMRATAMLAEHLASMRWVGVDMRKISCQELTMRRMAFWFVSGYVRARIGVWLPGWVRGYALEIPCNTRLVKNWNLFLLKFFLLIQWSHPYSAWHFKVRRDKIIFPSLPVNVHRFPFTIIP